MWLLLWRSADILKNGITLNLYAPNGLSLSDSYQPVMGMQNDNVAGGLFDIRAYQVICRSPCVFTRGIVTRNNHEKAAYQAKVEELIYCV